MARAAAEPDALSSAPRWAPPNVCAGCQRIAVLAAAEVIVVGPNGDPRFLDARQRGGCRKIRNDVP